MSTSDDVTGPSDRGGPVGGPATDRTARGAAGGADRLGRPLRVLRGVAYAALPAEAVLVVCLVAGVRTPGIVLGAVELLLVTLFVVEGLAFLRLRRTGHSPREALGVLVPEPVLRLLAHEARLLGSLVRWAGRRAHGVESADAVFPHARDQAALMYGFAFVCVVETIGVSYMLADWPVAHAVLLVLDVYTVFFVLGLHAASATRPHTLSGGVLRLRQAAHVDVRVPLDRIATVRREPLFSHEKREGELNLAVGSQTSVTIELAEPVDAPRLLGAPRAVSVLRVHADDPQALYRALTQARTAPWPSPGPPRSA
ncbi:hypothetical protein ACFW2Y_19755 [Streptomyces sp. NPDC058877]|uniref:hypothetical protein n=1 Tax=Streptomyces sp. NPDC058877 TaxID=3346665 RepID=UPI00367F2E67